MSHQPGNPGRGRSVYSGAATPCPRRPTRQNAGLERPRPRPRCEAMERDAPGMVTGGPRDAPNLTPGGEGEPAMCEHHQHGDQTEAHLVDVSKWHRRDLVRA